MYWKMDEGNCLTESIPSLGLLGRLPFELRHAIYTLLLVASRATSVTWGKGSGISTSILAVSKAVNYEAEPLLYRSSHTVGCFYNASRCLPPRSALLRMNRLTVEINYCTNNRGECEQYINQPELWWLRVQAEFVGLTLRHNDVLKELYICLLNRSLRKLGQKRMRTQKVKDEVERVIEPFARLRDTIPTVEVVGFDTLDFAEMFDEMRGRLAGTPVPIEEMLADRPA